MPNEMAVLRAALKANPEVHDKLRSMAEKGMLSTFEDIDPNEPLIVIAAPEPYGIVGSIQAHCECGAVVWLSPSTQAMLKARGDAPTQLSCILCMYETLKSAREEKRIN